MTSRDTAELSLRDRAEVLAREIALGIVSVADVIAWADAIVAASDAPHWSVCEVATMSRATPLDIAAALRAVPGPVDERRVTATVLRDVATYVEAEPQRLDGLVLALIASPETFHESFERAARWADGELELRLVGFSNKSQASIASGFARELRDAATSIEGA